MTDVPTPNFLTPDFLTPDIVDAVRAHMNTDHAHDNVTICRSAGAVPDVTAAELVGFDRVAATFAAITPGGAIEVRVPFRTALADRAQIRAEFAAMVHEAEQ